MGCQIAPDANPSKDTTPIITTTSATIPGARPRVAIPDSGVRSRIRRPSRVKGARRANSPK